MLTRAAAAAAEVAEVVDFGLAPVMMALTQRLVAALGLRGGPLDPGALVDAATLGDPWRPEEVGVFNVVTRLSHYAAAEAQALCTAVICSGVGCAGHSGRNRAAMMVRRSLASMSAKDGSVLVVYQGAAARWVVTSSGWWPERVYQQ